MAPVCVTKTSNRTAAASLAAVLPCSAALFYYARFYYPKHIEGLMALPGRS